MSTDLTCNGCGVEYDYSWALAQHIAAGQTYNDRSGILTCDPRHPRQVRWRQEHGLETDLELSQSIEVIQEDRE